jgi:hypothetical protein
MVEAENTKELQFKYFRSTGIDIVKLRHQKEWRLILRMLRVYNDIALSPSVSFLLQFAPPGPELDPIKEAINSHLLRHRSSMAAEAMRNVIEPLRIHQDDATHEIWAIIRNDADLEKIWSELSSDKYRREKEKATAVRDKLFAHYDQAPVDCAFEKLLGLHAEKNSQQAVHWHLQSSGDGGQISRNVLLDELMNLAWYKVYEIEANLNGPDNAQSKVVVESLVGFLSLVQNFVNGIIIAYVEKYNCTTIESKPPWHHGPNSVQTEGE